MSTQKINKKELLKYLKKLKNPELQGKALGYTLGNTIAGGTLGAITGEFLGSPVTGASIGATLGGTAGFIKSKKYLNESSSKVLKSESVPCVGIKKKLGFSCKKDKNGFFITTHRARSASYTSFDKIPLKIIKFIDSTG